MKKAPIARSRPRTAKADGRQQKSISLYKADLDLINAIAADMTEPDGKPASDSDVIRDALRVRAARISTKESKP